MNDVATLQFPADGKIFYGTQRSRPGWDAEKGELEEVKEGKEVKEKIASYEAEPIVLAEDSESADVTAELVDVGEGTKESDYSGKSVKGKIVLVGAQPGAVQDLAVWELSAMRRIKRRLGLAKIKMRSGGDIWRRFRQTRRLRSWCL